MIFNPFVRPGNPAPGGGRPAGTSGSGRRFFLWVFLAALCWTGSAIGQSEKQADSLPRGLYPDFKPHGDIRRFDGERLLFDISFLFFENAATADIHFFQKNGRFYSVLKAETKGFVGFFTAYRRHYYRASFDLIDNGSRVRTRKFEREVIVGSKVENTVHYLDYHNRRHFWFKRVNNKIVEQENNEIPEGKYYDDILAAFYNFRNEVYGPIRKGARYKIDTIPDKGMTDITVNIFSEAEQEKMRRQMDRPKAEELLLRVIIPKEVFKTENGELLFWASPHFIPLETTVVNYLLLGDLHVKFRERLIQKNPPGPTPIKAR